MINPASYPPNDGAESRAIAVVERLIDHDLVKTSFAKRDKFPNIDGFMELVRIEGATGTPVGKIDVQIKTLEVGSTKFQCPAELVAYAETVTTLPVLLICADHTKNRAFWKHVHGKMPEFKTGQSSFVVKFDPAFDAIDEQRLYLPRWHAIVQDYKARLSGTPGSVEEAVKQDVSQLMKLDPRLYISMNYIDSAKHYTLHPKETINASLNIPMSEAQKIEEHINYGKPLLLEVPGMSLKGSPVFDQMSKDGIAKVSAGPTRPNKLEMQLWTEGPEALRQTLKGEIYFGKIGMFCVARLGTAPLAFEFKILKSVLSEPKPSGLISIRWLFSAWNDHPVASLPHFEQMRDFGTAITWRRTIKFQLDMNGSLLTRGHFGHPADLVPFAVGAAVIDYVGKARELSNRLNVEIRFPKWEELSYEQFESLDIAYGIIFENEFKAQGSHVSFSASLKLLEGDDPTAFIAKHETVKEDGYTIMFPHQRISVFDTVVSLGSLSYSLAPAKIVMEEPHRTDFIAGRIKSAPIRIRAASNSAVLRIYRMLPPSTLARSEGTPFDLTEK